MLLIPPRLPPVRTFPAPGTHLCGMAWDGVSLWHSDADTELIYRVDPQTGSVLGQIPCSAVRTDLAHDGQCLWQIAGHPKRIKVLDPRDGRLVREIDLGRDSEDACGLHVGADRFWIGWKAATTIEERDLTSHRVLAEYPALPHIAGLAERDGTLWFTDFEGGLLVAVERPSGLELGRVQLEGNPTGLCWDGTFFWYCDYASRRLCAVGVPRTPSGE